MVPFNTNNYFHLFSIPQQFQVDIKDLTERYRELQAQVHPDRVAGGSDQEKIQAIQATSLLNEAYQTLKSAQSRAAYLLHLHEIDVNKVDQSDLGTELLMGQIQLREQLEDIPRDESGLGALENMRGDMESRLLRAQERFAVALEESRLKDARRDYYEMQYLSKLLNEIEAVEEDLLGY